ncbi:sulfotransferase [Halomonas halodenitrificans]|uniref:sulfotransferase n=1 Tax=Halomonas halodenitrificans TaxID=28252 RepID=UPI000486F1F6|nr:sulfotransferase [Halomonas halodenitrificans]
MLKKFKRYVGRIASDFIKQRKSKGKIKYFCIGRNKTGTTSLKAAFEALDYPMGNQRKAEVLTVNHYFAGNFQPIVDYCKSAQVFQDVPFSYPETYKHLDKAYPGSKFILTVRDSPEQWYNSITRFHAKMFGKDGRIPTAEDLRAAKYAWPGFMYNVVRVHGTTDEDPYNKDTMIAHYERYNREVVEHFKDRPEDLLVINVAEKGAYQKFVRFLGVNSPCDDFPWENRT